jgi:glycosyltransferase involved in cell wall biosynthesis
MKICHVSTFWPNRWGHSHYTDNLIKGMRAHDPAQHLVAAESPADAVETDAYRVVPCFRRNEDYVEQVSTTVGKEAPDVAIFQYSNDVFGDDDRFPRLLARLRGQGIETVVNTHSVYPERWRTRYRPGRTSGAFDRAVAAHASAFTVHSDRMRADLIARGIPGDQIVVIPHGSRAMEVRDPVASRRELGIPADAKVVLFFGFVWLGKGLSFLLDVFADVHRRLPDAYLFVGGHTRKSIWGFYMTYLRARMRLLGIADRSRLWGSYVPEEAVPGIYAAADVVALPYRQDYSSVSGVVHQTAGIGKLMLCSQVAKFDEVSARIDSSLTVGAHDRRAWADGLTKLLTDTPYAQAMRGKIRAFAEATSWERVGAQQLELARSLVGASSRHSTTAAVARHA